MICAGEKVFDTNGTGAKVFLVDWIPWSGLSSIMKAKPTLLKLVSVNKTSCFPGMGCFNASWHASFSALLTESKFSSNSDVLLIETFVFKKLQSGLSFQAILGKKISNSLRTLDSAASLSSIWGISTCLRCFERK